MTEMDWFFAALIVSIIGWLIRTRGSKDDAEITREYLAEYHKSKRRKQ